MIKWLILDWEQTIDASCSQKLSWSLSDFWEIVKITFRSLGGFNQRILLLLHTHASCHDMIVLRWGSRSGNRARRAGRWWAPVLSVLGRSSRPRLTILPVAAASLSTITYIILIHFLLSTSIRWWRSTGWRGTSSIVTLARGVILRTSSGCFAHCVLCRLLSLLFNND